MSEEDLEDLLKDLDIEAAIDAVKEIQENVKEAIIKESIEDPTKYKKSWIKKLKRILS